MVNNHVDLLGPWLLALNGDFERVHRLRADDLATKVLNCERGVVFFLDISLGDRGLTLISWWRRISVVVNLNQTFLIPLFERVHLFLLLLFVLLGNLTSLGGKLLPISAVSFKILNGLISHVHQREAVVNSLGLLVVLLDSGVVLFAGRYKGLIVLDTLFNCSFGFLLFLQR